MSSSNVIEAYYMDLAYDLIEELNAYDMIHRTHYRACFDANPLYRKGKDVEVLAECLSKVVPLPTEPEPPEKVNVGKGNNKK